MERRPPAQRRLCPHQGKTRVVFLISDDDCVIVEIGGLAQDRGVWLLKRSGLFEGRMLLQQRGDHWSS
jgi:hypothetical protein